MTSSTALESLLRARLSEFGITRLADTTGLDRTGIPTASAVRPGTADVIWVYSGKGLSQSHARSVAIMECLERTCALWPTSAEALVRTQDQLKQQSPWPVWGPERFTEGRWPNAASASIPWTLATSLTGGGQVWVPADLVFAGHRPTGVHAASPFRVRTSNGLAAALDTDSAICHALFEIAERDIVSHYEVIASHAGVSYLAAVGRQLGINVDWLSETYRDDVSRAVTVDPVTVPPVARRLVDRFEVAGLTLVIKALPNDLGLPAFGVACMDQVTLAEVLGCAGYAVRATPDEALVAALLELAQTRATDLQGAREDRHDVEKRRLTHATGVHWLATPDGSVSYITAAALFAPTTQPSCEHAIRAFEAVGLSDIAVVEFAAPTGISAVRVLVPGAETWHSTGGEAQLGPRLAKRINHA